MEEMIKIAVVLEDIYYGILANSGIYSSVLDHGPVENSNGGMQQKSRSFYDPEGRWWVHVYTEDGRPSFSYLAHYLEDVTRDEQTPQFRCEVFVQSVDSYDSFHSDFDSFRGLILFLIDLVLSGKVYLARENDE